MKQQQRRLRFLVEHEMMQLLIQRQKYMYTKKDYSCAIRCHCIMSLSQKHEDVYCAPSFGFFQGEDLSH